MAAATLALAMLDGLGKSSSMFRALLTLPPHATCVRGNISRIKVMVRKEFNHDELHREGVFMGLECCEEYPVSVPLLYATSDAYIHQLCVVCDCERGREELGICTPVQYKALGIVQR